MTTLQPIHAREERPSSVVHPDVNMTSVDSGVETGNDSNDSTVVTAAAATVTTTGQQQSIGYGMMTIASSAKRIDEQRGQQSERQQVQQQQEPESSIFHKGIQTRPLDLQVKIKSMLSTEDRFIELPVPTKLAFDYSAREDWKTESEFRRTEEYSKPRMCLNVPHRLKNRHPRKLLWTRFLPYRDIKALHEERMRKFVIINDVDYVRKILEHGISPNNCDEHGRTPLHHAACRGYTEMVHLLLAYGANPNQRDCVGNTPLHLAAVTSKISVVTLLLMAGTNVLSLDQHGYNPLQLAQTKLKMMQTCNDNDMVMIKKEMHDIVDMLMVYLQKQNNMREQVESLSNFCSRLSLSNTSEQVQDDVKDLLANIETLSITT